MTDGFTDTARQCRPRLRRASRGNKMELGYFAKIVTFVDSTDCCKRTGHYLLGYFTFWISLSLRPKTETKRLNFGLSPELSLTNYRNAHECSLHNVIADIVADISVLLCLFVN